jgi:hypothetical protein
MSGHEAVDGKHIVVLVHNSNTRPLVVSRLRSCWVDSPARKPSKASLPTSGTSFSFPVT